MYEEYLEENNEDEILDQWIAEMYCLTDFNGMKSISFFSYLCKLIDVYSVLMENESICMIKTNLKLRK